jgi:hypothetical protein
MPVRITIMIMRLCVLVVLILGILFWAHIAGGPLVLLHMGLGILVALSLLILGCFILTVKGRNIGLAIGAFVLAIGMVALGLSQQSILVGSQFHWTIQMAHLLVGLLAIGMGEMIAGRYKRLRAAAA